MQTGKIVTDRLRDTRSTKKLYQDFNTNMKREVLVMKALSAYHYAYGYETWYEKIDTNEQQGIDLNATTYRANPDYYYYLNQDGIERTYTYEIKCSDTGKFIDDTVFVKRPAIWTMTNDKFVFPNGSLLVATQSKFAIMKASIVSEYPEIETEYWGNKKLFHIPVEDFKWHSWLEPIKEWHNIATLQ